MSFDDRRDPKQQNLLGQAFNPKRRSPLGVMFNPEIGLSIKPLGHALGLFPQIIAMIFVMNGLLPRNYIKELNLSPDSVNTLSLSRIMHDAWSRLEFTSDGAPKVALFFAVVLCFILTGMAAITALFMVLVGTAHAQTTTSGATTISSPCSSGFFTACSASQDLAQGWLNFIFNLNGGQAAPDMQVAASGLTQSNMLGSSINSWQQAMISVLAFYADAILVVAAFILFYHLTSMVVETAHHGEPMGKRASQIWAPIRLVVAIGLIVPLPNTSGSAGGMGLSSGQYIVIQMAEWGSGLGSQVWAQFVGNLVSNDLAMPPSPYLRGFSQNIAMIAACTYLYNYYTGYTGSSSNTAAGGTGTGTTTPTISGMDSAQVMQQSGTYSDGSNARPGTIYYYTVKSANGMSASTSTLCGSISLPSSPFSSSTTGTTDASGTQSGGNIGGANSPTNVQIGQAYSANVGSAYNTAITAAMATATTDVQTIFGQAFVGPNTGAPPPTIDIVDDISNSFVNAFNSSLQNAFSGLNSISSSIQSKWVNWGWVAAGTYFNDISSTQSVITNILKDMQPQITPPAILDAPDGTVSSELVTKTQQTLNEFARWANDNHEQALAGIATTGTTGTTSSTTTAANPSYCNGVGDDKAIDNIENAAKHWSPMDAIFATVDWIAAKNCVWQIYDASAQTNPETANTFQMAIKFNTNNPFAEISQLGHNNLNVAYQLFDWYIGVTALNIGADAVNGVAGSIFNSMKLYGARTGINFLTQSVKSLGAAAAPIISFLGLVFFICGFLLAFFLPLMPFTRFFFNILTWFVMVLEAVVAVPLIALAHLNPEGEGLPGASAKGAYFFIFDIFLRPALLVFGMCCSYLVFLAAVAFLNTMFAPAVVGAGGLGHPHIVMTRMIFSMMYVMLLYTAANNSFKLIHFIPDHAMRWMGQQSLHKESIGEAETLAGHVNAITGFAGTQMMSAMQSSSQGFQQNIGKALERPGNDARKADAASTALNKSYEHQERNAIANERAANALEQHSPRTSSPGTSSGGGGAAHTAPPTTTPTTRP